MKIRERLGSCSSLLVDEMADITFNRSLGILMAAFNGKPSGNLKAQ